MTEYPNGKQYRQILVWLLNIIWSLVIGYSYKADSGLHKVDFSRLKKGSGEPFL